jgi:hypothetical protein
MAQTEAAAKSNGVKVHVVNVPNAEQLERAFATIGDNHDEGVIVQGPIFTTSFGRIALLSLRHRLPSVPRSTLRRFFAAPDPPIFPSSNRPNSTS